MPQVCANPQSVGGNLAFRAEAEAELLRRSISPCFAYPGFLLVLWIGTDYFSEQHTAGAWLTALIVCTTVMRLMVAFRNGLFTGKPVACPSGSCRKVLGIAIVVSGLTWGFFLAHSVVVYGYTGFPTIVMMVLVSGSAAGGIASLQSHSMLQKMVTIAMLMPSVGVHLWIGEREGVSMAVLFVLYMTFLWVQAAAIHRIYWKSIESNDLLAERARELERAHDAVLEAGRAKDLFLANVSHELRTPLNAIIGYSEMVMEEAEDLTPDRLVEDVAKIRAAGVHQLRLVNDVLDLNRLEAGRMNFASEPFLIPDLVDEAISFVTPAARAKGNSLETRLAPECGQMYGDELRLRQSLINLLGNACKFTEAGKVTVEARIERDERTEWLHCEVRDTGPGMTEEQMSRLFRPFSQVHDNPKYGGSGLGLAISQRICRSLGGDLLVNSEVGVGTVMTIRVPTRNDLP